MSSASANAAMGKEQAGDTASPSSLTVTTTKTSEITIIMKTLVSNTTKKTTENAKKCDCGDDDSQGVSTVQVTTSARSVFVDPAVDCNRDASKQPIVNKNFMTLLKTANDSSFENVLEFKSLLGGISQSVKLKSSEENLLGGDTDREIRNFLSDLCEHNTSVCCKLNGSAEGGGCCVSFNKRSEQSCLEKNDLSVIEGSTDFKHCLSSSESDHTANDSVLKRPKLFDDNKGVRFTVSKVVEQSKGTLDFLSLPSSTPIKVRVGKENEIPGGPCRKESYTLNLLTPPADASFIDSDFESMEQDQYDTCSSKESLKFDDTCFQKVMDLVETSKPATMPPEASHVSVVFEAPPETPTRVRKTSSTKAFFEEALKTPLALRKRFQKRRNSEIPKQPSHSNLLHFFTSKKKSTSLEGVPKPVHCKKSITSDNSSETSPCASPALTEENLRRLSNTIREADLSNRTLVWGDNYDYSYECEPPHSDVEEVDENETIQESTRLVHFNTSPDSSFEMQPPIVPTFRIDPPQAINIASELAQSLISTAYSECSSGIKRSVSDPVNCKARSRSCTPLTSDFGETDEDDDEEEEPIMKEAHVHFHSVHEASLRSLDKISVSTYHHATFRMGKFQINRWIDKQSAFSCNESIFQNCNNSSSSCPVSAKIFYWR